MLLGIPTHASRQATASRASHHGNMGSVAMLNPFMLPRPVRSPGYPIGFYTSRQPFYMDVHLWKRLGVIDAPIVYGDGAIGKGKTSLAIVAADNAANLAVEEDRNFKAMFEITRRNVGVAELEVLARNLDATVHDMSVYGLNIFSNDNGLSRGEQLDIVLECRNYVEGTDATTFETLVYTAALDVFYRNCEADDEYRRDACNRFYEKCLANLTIEDYRLSMSQLEQWELDEDKKLDDEAANADQEKREEILARKSFASRHIAHADDIHVDAELFYQTRDACLRSFLRLRRGEYGRVFSGKHSLMKLLSTDAIGLDLTMMNESTIGLLQTIIWKAKRSRINTADMESRRDFVIDWEIHDENRDAWLSGPYRREVPRYMKRVRSFNGVLWFNCHRIPGDYETLPEDARNAALNAARESTVRFHGYRSKSDAEALCQHFGYNAVVENRLQALQLGQFIVTVGSDAPQEIQVFLSEAQRADTFSEAASRAKTTVSPRLAALARLT